MMWAYDKKFNTQVITYFKWLYLGGFYYARITDSLQLLSMRSSPCSCMKGLHGLSQNWASMHSRHATSKPQWSDGSKQFYRTICVLLVGEICQDSIPNIQMPGSQMFKFNLCNKLPISNNIASLFPVQL